MTSFWIQKNNIIINKNNEFFYSDVQPCKKVWWIIGTCNGTSAGTISVIKSNTIPQIEDTYVLSGPYVNEDYAKSIKDNFTEDLAQKCKGNTLTTVLSWNSDGSAGCDLDIIVEVLNEKYGWGYNTGTGTYGQHYGDDTSCNCTSGGEKVSFNRNALINSGTSPVEIKIYAHWYSSYKSGIFTLSISSSKNIFNQDFTCLKKASSSDQSTYIYYGSLFYTPSTDTFTFTPAETTQ